MSEGPKEAFPWTDGVGVNGDLVLDANGFPVFTVWGYVGSHARNVPGITERVRLALSLPALIEFAKRFATIGDMRAQKILTDIGESWPAPIPTQEPEQPPEPSGITTEDGTPVFFVAHHTGG